jgi:hypothetical protein
MNLLDLQRRMAQDVSRPLTANFEMQSLTDDGHSVQAIAESYIRPNDRLSSFERLEIYNRQYWFRLIAAVTEDFTALQAVVGAKRFDVLVLAYLRENPSTSFTLRDLGAKLPQWLESHAEVTARRHRLALDVARLEWAYVEAFDSATLKPLDESDLAQLTGDSTLSLQPHLQLLELSYPVDELVLAVHKAIPATDATSNAVMEIRQVRKISLPRMRRSTIYLAVHRYEDSVYYRRLDREAYRLLRVLQQQRLLAEALEFAFAESKIAPEQQALKTQQYFAHAAELGWFTKQ